MSTSLKEQLQLGIAELKLDLAASVLNKLLAYLAQLEKWNKAYNLTAIHGQPAMLSHHLLDSLAVVPFIYGNRVLDVGTGAGLPGIPLALAMPEREFVLLDSNGKKTRFLLQLKHELDIANVQIVQSRVEAYQATGSFSCIVSRAFSSIIEMLQKTAHLCCNDGRFLAMKGVYPSAELAIVPPAYRLVDVSQLQVPGLVAERHLVIIARN